MSAQAVGHVWKYADFGGAKLLVLLAVADIANDVHNNEIFMGSEKLAAKCRMHPGNVRKRLKELVADGWLIELAVGGGLGKTSRYRFVPVDITAPSGAQADIDRVIQREQTRSTARHKERTQSELKTKEDSARNNNDDCVDNHNVRYERKHPRTQIERNAGGVAKARAALSGIDNASNEEGSSPDHAANTPPPPKNP
jgi:hypothetical protein